MEKAEAIKWLSEMMENCSNAKHYNDPHRAKKMQALSMAIRSLEAMIETAKAKEAPEY